MRFEFGGTNQTPYTVLQGFLTFGRGTFIRIYVRSLYVIKF